MSVIWTSPDAKYTHHGSIWIAFIDVQNGVQEKCYMVRVLPASVCDPDAIIVPYEAARRLWSRFATCMELRAMLDGNYAAVPFPLYYDTLRHNMPGERCEKFLEAIIATLKEIRCSRTDYTWMAPSSVYRLWWYTCTVTAEMFVDSFGESGVLRDFCGFRQTDAAFGSIGKWEDVEDEVEGAAGVPPLQPKVLTLLIDRFEQSVQKPKAYCRCVVLPLESHRSVQERMNRMSTNVFLLVTVPKGCFPLKHCQYRFSIGTKKDTATLQVPMGIYVWVNREYLLRYPPPHDVEALYKLWIVKSLRNSEQVRLHAESFQRAFPMELRSGYKAASRLLAELE